MQLYNYQRQYLATLPDSVIMHAGLGLGKTAMSLNHWRQRNPLLVVAPAAKIRTLDWQAEAQAWLGSDLAASITFISYEKLRLNVSKTIKPNWWQFVASRNGGVVYDVIADECQALKNPQSKQAKAILEIKQSGGQFIGLTGTPMANGWIDFAGYSKLFGFTKGITEFKNKYVRYVPNLTFPKIAGYINQEQMADQWASISRTLTREQATELPDRQFIGKTLTMSPKEQKAYLTAKIERVAPHSGKLLDNPSLLLNHLRQVSTACRLDELSDVLDGTQENIVVFYNYISERKAIIEHIKKHHKQKSVLRMDGDKHDKLPAPDAKLSNVVLLAHYKSASSGLNLQFANVTVYFSPTYSYQEYEQSIGRTHRTGQTKKCVYFLFRVKNTIDDDIYQALKNKQSFSTTLWSKGIDSD